MAKKRKAPSKLCPKCGKSIHPRSKTCKHCGNSVVSTRRKRSVTKSVNSRKKPARTTGGANFITQLKSERNKLVKRLDAIDAVLDAYKKR